jgi:hypothetical protein
MNAKSNIVRVTTPRSIVPAQSRPSGSLAPILVPAAVALAGMAWSMLRRRKAAAQPETPIEVAPPASPVQAIEIRMTMVALVRRVEL